MATGWNVDDVTVGTTAVILTGGATVANREILVVHNTSTSTIHLGPSGVTASTGLPLLKGEKFRIDESQAPNGAVTALYGISESDDVVVNVFEFEHA